jgi:uncharacterized protein (TIGR00297 family)
MILPSKSPLKAKYFWYDPSLRLMDREDAARIALGLMVLLLPFSEIAALAAVAAIFYLCKPMRMLSSSLFLLLVLKLALELIDLDLPLYVVAIAFIPPTFAYLASKKFNPLAGSLIYLIAVMALGYPSAMLVSSELSHEKVLFLSLLGGLSGALLQHVSREPDFTVPFGTCMAMWLFSFDYPLPELGRIFMIYLFALALGLGAYWAKAADVDAVLSEVVICLLVVLFTDVSWFLLLLSFYLLGGGFTRYKYAYKKDLGIAQSRGGVRGYKNVYSNSLVPLAMAVCHGIYSSDIFLYAFLGAVATANGDTLASEIGQTSRSKPRMITTLKPVEPGVDGGVTSLGEAAAFFGAAAIGLLAMAWGKTGSLGLLAAIMGGFLGTNFDSLLGATLQQRGLLTNNGVNLLATLFGALVGAALWTFMV